MTNTQLNINMPSIRSIQFPYIYLFINSVIVYLLILVLSKSPADPEVLSCKFQTITNLKICLLYLYSRILKLCVPCQ